MLGRSITHRSQRAIVTSIRTTAPTHMSPQPPKLFSSSSSSLPSWPHAMVESKGDYKDEAYLEDVIGGPLYQYQKSLPRLPVPELAQTLKKLLPTALPLASTPEETEKFIEAVEAFPVEAAELHKRLVERREKEGNDSSWLQYWWNTAGYLQVRDPVVVNVSYFFHFVDDTTLPQQNMIQRGAALLAATAEFRLMVASGSLPAQTIGRGDKKTPLCSVAMKYMFHTCRIPRLENDTVRLYDPSCHSHAVIACRGQFYALDFLDEDGQALPLETIEARLKECVELSESDAASLPSLGWLTSHDRDSWATARAELVDMGLNEALERLESGAILLCLDMDESPVSRTQCGNLFWTGGISSGHNRWFDKSIQLMVGKNGKAGLIGEHSMMDGECGIMLSLSHQGEC